MKPDERMFEDAIEAWLLENGGYAKSLPTNFDPISGIDTNELYTFIGATQPTEWRSLVDLYGSDSSIAQREFVKRLASEIDNRGTVDVLRRGVIDRGVTMRLAFFKPAHHMTPALQELYESNRITVTRQLPYDPKSHNTIDLALLVNGIPTATAELKNHLTGQTVEDAIIQYREDRDPTNTTLARRALVHFAVDPDRVAMTTKLSGKTTSFLPFNLGHDLAPGNPPNPHGHRTAYLWERVWTKDAWMDLLERFIHVQRPTQGSAIARREAQQVIFPRFHQWDAVLKLEADARERGPGHNYLIEHSAGSGKSNTIAWTAHRLSSLHDYSDEKVFDKAIVITDRVILDRQLQETIYQFEQTRGVVVRIDKDSHQLAEALKGEQARIVVTTLQKFPFVLKEIRDLPKRRYAVIVDEAHSSQTGDTAHNLRLALGTAKEDELEIAEHEDANFVAEAQDPVEQALAKLVGARGRQPNLSFFAFTATPKGRTLDMFGTPNPETGRNEPFHLYSMRQAIGEGFIRDVLAYYATYKTYSRIEKKIEEDPLYEAPKARRAIARFVALHPTNLAQKSEIIVEHFRIHTASKIAGRAKAMVVTSSRLHAIRYKQTIDAYIAKQGYTDLAALVAFSGKVIDEHETAFTEAQMNGLPESETAERFGGDDYQVLIVAEKFQTGFDQPLLHTMYVDKVLTGLNAVQTLSRLNRTHPDKDDTFVLDFRNDTEDIVKAFEPYYGRTVAPPTDPNLLFDTRRRLDDFDVLRPGDVKATVALFLTIEDPRDHGRIYASLDPTVERFDALNELDRTTFKEVLERFVRTYSFLSQIVPFTDSTLECNYIFCRTLSSRLRDSASAERLDLGEEVELTHLRNELAFEGALQLENEQGEVRTIFGEGAGRKTDSDFESLAEIVEQLNARFGLELDERDQLLFEQFEQTWITDPEVIAQARSNSLENFRLAFDSRFMDTIVDRMGQNEEIFKQILDNDGFRQTLMDVYAARVYRRAVAHLPSRSDTKSMRGSLADVARSTADEEDLFGTGANWDLP